DRSRPALAGSAAACLNAGGSAVSVVKSLISGPPPRRAAPPTNTRARARGVGGRGGGLLDRGRVGGIGGEVVDQRTAAAPRRAPDEDECRHRRGEHAASAEAPSAYRANDADHRHDERQEPAERERPEAGQGGHQAQGRQQRPEGRERHRDEPEDVERSRRSCGPARGQSHARTGSRPGPAASIPPRHFTGCIRHVIGPHPMSSAHGTNVVGIILAGGEGKRLFPLTRARATPAVPFGGRYRIVDIVLSNFVNSGIYKLNVITQYKAGSLMQHLARGWQLAPQMGHHVSSIPPAMKLGPRFFEGSADAVLQNLDVIENE